ncbi:MAG: hypothetical protein Q9191_006992 [Dirinaria sp. TL-2023a]
MSSTVDYGRLTAAGVSPEGIDFVKNMLVLEPSERSSDAECLAHPWIIDLSRAAKADMDMGDFAGGDQELDASQLSIQEDQAEQPRGDGNEGEGLDAEEIFQYRRQEHSQSGSENSHPEEPQPEESLASVPSYETIPMTYNFDNDNVRRRPDVSAGNRLFGEIGSSALDSSGILGQTAYTALDIDMEGNRDESVSVSGGDKVEATGGATDSHVTYGEVAPQQQQQQHQGSHRSDHPLPPPHSPRQSQVPESSVPAGPATTLLSTEVQIGQLNMASPGSTHSMPSPDNKPETPSASANTGSKRPSMDVQSADEHNTKRAKTHRSSRKPRAHHGSAEASMKQRRSRTSGSHVKDGQSSRQAALQESQPHQIASGEGAGDSQRQQPRESAQDAHSEAVVPGAQEHHQRNTAISRSRASKQRHKSSTGDSNSTSTSTVQDNPAPASEFKVPLVPERPPLGKLQVVPGSVCGFLQKAKGAEKTNRDRQSKDFDEQLAITFKTRWLFFGRLSEEEIPYPNATKLDYTHITHADNWDTRVGKQCIDLAFWRNGIESDEAEGKDWVRANDFWAILMNRSSMSLFVNDVRLEKGKDRALYGKLYTGDIITVFEQEEPGKGAEFLKFECEFFRGLSRQRRPERRPFTIEEESERLYRWRLDEEKKSRRRSSTASGNHDAAAAAQDTVSGIESAT